MRRIDRLWLGRKLMLVVSDVIVFIAVLAVTSSIREPNSLDPNIALLFLPVLCFCIITAYTSGLYELRLVRDFVALVGGSLGSTAACSLFAISYFYLLSSYLKVAPKFTLFLVIVGAHAGMFVWRRVVLAVTSFTLGDLKILILGDRTYRDHLRESVNAPANDEFNIVDSLDEDVSVVVVDRHWTDRHPQDARPILADAIANRIPIVSIDEFHESQFGKVAPQHANDLAWALDHVLPRSGSLYFSVKRLLDVIAAALLLLVLTPTMLVVAIAIALIDGVSPFYGQFRTGHLGKTFRLWKLRTMREDAEHEGPFIQVAAGSDPRVTRLGSALRRLRVDELPQLWNVFKGDMSLVGPRPEWIKEAEILEKTVPTYSLRYLVPPGLTGWAQVRFRATNNPLDSIEKHNYDLYYLKHFSLALDFSIMLKTIKRVLVNDARVADGPILTRVEPATGSHPPIDIASIVGRS